MDDSRELEYQDEVNSWVIIDVEAKRIEVTFVNDFEATLRRMDEIQSSGQGSRYLVLQFQDNEMQLFDGKLFPWGRAG
jgi:hypothetical protein